MLSGLSVPVTAVLVKWILISKKIFIVSIFRKNRPLQSKDRSLMNIESTFAPLYRVQLQYQTPFKGWAELPSVCKGRLALPWKLNGPPLGRCLGLDLYSLQLFVICKIIREYPQNAHQLTSVHAQNLTYIRTEYIHYPCFLNLG